MFRVLAYFLKDRGGANNDVRQLSHNTSDGVKGSRIREKKEYPLTVQLWQRTCPPDFGATTRVALLAPERKQSSGLHHSRLEGRALAQP